tara:strand:+ start:29 stop:145 length:117 start_codon:yes stop_codon:yes gene_type:complete
MFTTVRGKIARIVKQRLNGLFKAIEALISAPYAKRFKN